MESAKRYIEKDDAFLLHRINCLDLYLKDGITLFVDEFGSKYHDMTLIQYAIAKRKPKTLKDMLETSYTQCQVPLEKIISPVTSNTKGSLLSLAIEFDSKNEEYGKDYKEENNECLKEIIDFLQNIKNNDNKELNVDIENINGETPLIRAIHLQNVEACQLLIQNGADILHKSTKNDFLDNPLIYLFKNARYYNLLSEVIEKKVLGEDKYRKVFDICRQIFHEKMNEINNKQTQKFLQNLFEEEEKPKPEPKSPTEPQTEIDQDDQKCPGCDEELLLDGMKSCNKCGKTFCRDCYPNHKCSGK